METKAALCAAVHEVLDKDNYVDWSVRVKTYLMAQDLWDIVDATTEPPKQEDGEAIFKAWSKKNSMALHVIQISCGSDAFSKIREISSAKITWDTLAGKEYGPKDTVSRMDNDSKEYYELLFKALQSGEFNNVREYLICRPNAVNAIITDLGQTALHIASASRHLHIVHELMELMWEGTLEIKDYKGHTALFEALLIGNCKIAKSLVSRNKKLVSIGNKSNILPVVKAFQFGYTELAHYLYPLTPLDDLKAEEGVNGATLCTQAIYARNLDIALDLIERCPYLALALDKDNCSPLYALSAMPYAFSSGDQLVFWKRWICSCIRIQSAGVTNEIHLDFAKVEKRQSIQVKTIGSVLAPLRQLVSNLRSFTGIKHLYEMKRIHAHSHKLLLLMCNVISTSNMQHRHKDFVNEAIFCAIKNGNFEFLFHIVKVKSYLLRSSDRDLRNIFLLAVLHRQAKIFSLIYGLKEKNVMIYKRDIHNNSILHMAGMSAASTLLNLIPGPALQMQRELQWFKIDGISVGVDVGAAQSSSSAVGLIAARVAGLATLEADPVLGGWLNPLVSPEATVKNSLFKYEGSVSLVDIGFSVRPCNLLAVVIAQKSSKPLYFYNRKHEV